MYVILIYCNFSLFEAQWFKVYGKSDSSLQFFVNDSKLADCFLV